MNVCALDVIARAADFESVATLLELRGWEWDFLHDVDGTASLGEISHRTGIDLDSAIGFVHEASHRGLVYIPTMTLETYRLRTPMQTAISSNGHALSLGTSAIAEPARELALPAAEAPGAISFSSDTFDWNAPQPAFDEPEDSGEPLGGIHYDDRFGVEHPDGPFAVTHEQTLAPPSELPDETFAVTSHHDEPAHVEDPFSFASHAEAAHVPEPAHITEPEHVAEPFVAMHDHTEDPFSFTTHADDAHVPEPEHVAEPFVAMHEHADDPFSFTSHIAETPQLSHDDPFTFGSHVDDPFAIASHHDDPPISSNGVAHTNGTSNGVAHEPVHFEPYESTAVVSTNGHASHEVEPVHVEPTPGSISFSFSPDDPIDQHDAHAEAPEESPRLPAWIPITYAPEPTVVPAHETAQPVAELEPAIAEAPEQAPEPRFGQTQSTYFEREAIDNTDAARELEAKVKTWKESLTWREQQEINEAMDSGKDKSGVIGSLLRALGVR